MVWGLSGTPNEANWSVTALQAGIATRMDHPINNIPILITWESRQVPTNNLYFERVVFSIVGNNLKLKQRKTVTDTVVLI